MPILFVAFDSLLTFNFQIFYDLYMPVKSQLNIMVILLLTNLVQVLPYNYV